MTKDEALRMALEALEIGKPMFDAYWGGGQFDQAITAIKEALAQPEPKCNPHPKAPHGFNRNASHANDRYTCECEGWDAYDAGYHAGVMAGIEASMDEPKEPEQEPVAMKFKIYKPTAPDPVRQGINNALLPWVYDQDRSSGFDASMWVTPVATLPPQRKPLTDERIGDIAALYYPRWQGHEGFARAIEAAHGIWPENSDCHGPDWTDRDGEYLK